MKKSIKITYRVSLGGFDFDFPSPMRAVNFMETGIRYFVPDKWHENISISMEVIIETLDEEEPEETEKFGDELEELGFKEVEDDTVIISR